MKEEIRYGPTSRPLLESAKADSMQRVVSCVVNEIKVLDKEIELMQLRVSECTDRATEQTLRNFGSCLWRHKCALEKAIAANAEVSGQPPSATPADTKKL